MKITWCWRCKMDVPLLDEAEYAVIQGIYADCIGGVKQHRVAHNATLAQVPMTQKQFLPVLEAYQQMTGRRETNAEEVLHHRASIYGPPCRRCGKVLRTARASKCFECGLVVEAMS